MRKIGAILLATLLMVGLTSGTASASLFSGMAGVYLPGLGLCGETHTEADLVAGVSLAQFLGGAHCGDEIEVTRDGTGATTTATVVDLCVTCLSGDIDLSPAAFDRIGATSEGRVKVKWDFL